MSSTVNVASGGYWRPARRTDLWLLVEFGREVETERVVLVLHLQRWPGQDVDRRGARILQWRANTRFAAEYVGAAGVHFSETEVRVGATR